jgi:arylsulfatase A-like enzyme
MDSSTIERRDFLRAGAAGAAALALPRWLFAEQPTGRKPNIIFILFDDLGYGEPPCYRKDSPFKMPNLDRVATEGIRFTDAHTASGVCTPTRYGLLTGRYPWRIGQFGVLTFFSPPIIQKDRLTVASMLKAREYHTGCFGKWHLGMNWGVPADDRKIAAGTPLTDGPTTRGFDVFCGYTEARSIKTVIENDRVLGIVEPVDVQPLLAKKAVEYVDRRAKEDMPFFLYLPLSTPHTPIMPAKEFVGKSGLDAYGDWIFQGDWIVGQILEALDRNSLSDNTLLVVTSDNGAAGRPYAPLRASKASVYEGGHRVPFVARWPGRIKPNSVCHDTVCLNDLMATCAELVGVTVPDNAGEDSVSILPDLLGAAKGPVREATVHQSSGGDVAIRQGSWKLIFLTNGKKELYGLKMDIGETKDVASDHPDVVERLTSLMQQYIDTGRSTPGVPQKNDVPVKIGERRGKSARAEKGESKQAGKKKRKSGKAKKGK